MNRSVRLAIVLLVALLAFAMQVSVDAACKVKKDDTTGSDAEVNITSNNGNRIQDAPSKRMKNKIAFDVVDEAELKRKRMANKIAFDVTDNNGDAEASGEEDYE